MVSRIRSLCETRGITVAQLEREVIISNGSISKWDKSSPKADNLYKVATYFGVTMEYLLTGKENPADLFGGTETDNMIIDILSRVDPSVRQSVLDFLVSEGSNPSFRARNQRFPLKLNGFEGNYFFVHAQKELK